LRVVLATVLSAVVALSSQPGCTGQDDGDEQASQAVGLPSDWIRPACDHEALEQRVPNTCSGPWTFDYTETWNDPVACGEDPTQACIANNTCLSWDVLAVGDGLAATPVAPSNQTSANFTWSCRPTRPGGPQQCTGSEPSLLACTQQAATLRSQILAGLPGIPTRLANQIVVTGVNQTVGIVGPDPGTGLTRTTWRCRFAISGVTARTTGVYPVCGCAHYPGNTCERTRGTVVTAPGLPIPVDAGTPTFPGDQRAFVSGPTCMTCDQLPIDTDPQAQAKFDCFDQGLSTATGDLRTSLVARMKLLYQLMGERLTAAQRARVDAIYDQHPGASTSCSVAVSWEASCQATATPLGLPGPLQRCGDLAGNAATSPGIAALEAQRCSDQLAVTSQLTPDTCRLPIRDLASATAQAVVNRSYPPLTGELATTLPVVLARIGAWWTAATTAASGDRAWLLGESNALVRQLWTRIETAKLPLPAGALSTDAAAAALLADITNTGFLDDVGVLSALYAPAQPPATPPVLTLTGDALQPLADRLARLALLHDVGCRFARCKTASTLRASATSELVHALAVLPDRAKLTSVLAAATRLAQQQPGLYAALGRIRDQHAYLDAAWAALGRTDAFANLATVVEPPAEAATLASIVRSATVAWSSYQDSGELVPWHRPRLTTAALQQAPLIAFVDTLRATVAQARAGFEGARLETVNDLLAQSRQQGVMQSARDRAAALLDQAADLATRSLGLEEREAQERKGIAGYATAFEALVSSQAIDGNAAFQTETLAPFSASAADAHYPAPAAVRDVARDRFKVVAMRSGEALRLRVTNKWTPTCAIRSATLRAEDGHLVPIVTPTAETGPEGYWVSLSNGSFTAHSTTDSTDTRKSIGASIRACATATTGTPESSLRFSIEACIHASIDHIWSDATADGNGVEARTSASFASGVRLPATPFPEAPAGSLLAVVTRGGHPGEILDVRVVQRDDVIYAPALPAGAGTAVDVHFVVNDLGGCAVDTSNALQIEAVKTIPFGNVAKAIGNAMAATLTSIESQAPRILAQGQLTGEEVNALRATAWVAVQQALPAGTSLAGLPYDLRQLFESFLEGQLASMSRRAVMHAIAREQRQLQLTLHALANELAFADAQSRFLMLVPRWRLRDLSGVELATATGALSEALTAFVAQIYELRDPAAATQFRAQAAGTLNALIDLQITAPFEDSVTSLTRFATAARDALAAAQFDVAANDRLTVVVAVPRTTTQCGGVACDYGPFRSVSSTAATSFWATIASSPSSTALAISPADLYSLSGGASRLSCNEVAPIVRRVALYLDTAQRPSIDLAAIGMHVLGRAGTPSAAVTFPLAGQSLAIDVDDPAGIPMSLPALNGNTTTVLSKFGSSEALGTGAGISPFTAFRFDMTPFQTGEPKTALTNAGAVLLVLDVERRVSSQTAQVPGICP
jgi:hypothetical protein